MALTVSVDWGRLVGIRSEVTTEFDLVNPRIINALFLFEFPTLYGDKSLLLRTFDVSRNALAPSPFFLLIHPRHVE